MRNSILGAGLLVFLAAAPLAAQQRVTSVEGITEYRLANGLHVLLFPDQSKPTVTVNITYLVGSAQEGYGETGMAHLLEHLQFKGSTGPHEHPAGADRTRRADQRVDVARPDELLSRRCRRATPTCSGRSASKPTGWSTRSSRKRISTAR